MSRSSRLLLILMCSFVAGCGGDPAPVATPPPAKPKEGPPAAPFRFVDVAAEAGLTVPHREADDGRFRLIETMGSGVGLIDFDGDGRLDLFIGQGGAIPAKPGKAEWSSRLYRNTGGGRYEDVTDRAGVGFYRYAQGVAVGDFDGDGRPDLFVAGLGGSALYRNVDGSRFEDVSARAGVVVPGWPSSCAFADLDGDGDLDLFVVRYLANTVDAAGNPTTNCNGSPGKLGYCPPNAFPSETNLLFRNDGGGRFTDVSAASGISAAKGNGLGLAIADLDDDGRLDVFVANDQSPNLLFHNEGNLIFKEVGFAWGLALSDGGQTRAGMGVAAGDADGDGLLDLCVTNFFEEGVTLYRNLGEGRFQVATASARLLAPTRSKLGFGAGFLDADDDGRLDLFLANGHINDVTPVGMPYRMEAQIFRNGGGRFFDVSAESGDYFRTKRLGRAAAFGDLDDDGDVDIVVSHLQGPPALLRNDTPGGGRLTLVLESAGASKSPIGAKVEARVGERTLVRWVVGGSSYLASNDPRVILGLGDALRVDRLKVRWPSGRVQEWSDLEGSRSVRLVEGRPEVATVGEVR